MTTKNSSPSRDVRQPPHFCQFTSEACDQSFSDGRHLKGLILFPSSPPQIASTIEAAVSNITSREELKSWISWKSLDIHGQIIFCQICKAIRFADLIVADVTTLNQNLLFEIGVAFSLSKPVIPIRDTTYVRDKKHFDQLGLLDTLGYLDFQNSSQLSASIKEKINSSSLPVIEKEPNFEAPLYFVKGPSEIEAEIRLLAILKKSKLRFRAYDPFETTRISLHELRTQVEQSLGVVVHLVSSHRDFAPVHNARSALTAGLAFGAGKHILMLQEEEGLQPIDYRDVIKYYQDPNRLDTLVEPFLQATMDKLQSSRLHQVKSPVGLLQNLNIGDVAAENEIGALRSYFFETGQYFEAKRGHARLVIGRKGSGKTAIFYALRTSLKRKRDNLVLDLKPEGYQFTKLKDAVLSKLPEGTQEHTLAAFWYLILLSEIAHKVVETEESAAYKDDNLRDTFKEIRDSYERSWYAGQGDFSERLLRKVSYLEEQFGELGEKLGTGEITELLYSTDIRQLNKLLGRYLSCKAEVWVLVDNLDKSWPTRGASSEHVLILRTLLEAGRKLQRYLDDEGVDLKCLLFLRNDIYEHLLSETPDKGKDTEVSLDWSDSEQFKEIFRLRVEASGALSGSFENIWAHIFPSLIAMTDSFNFMVQRTLMRPRDFLHFVHRSIEVAINRGHTKVEKEDLEHAEISYSEDMLKSLSFELLDINPDYHDILLTFLGSKVLLLPEDVEGMIATDSRAELDIEQLIDLLCWFGFLGVKRLDSEETKYSYQVKYNISKLLAPIKSGMAFFEIHPAYHKALECET